MRAVPLLTLLSLTLICSCAAKNPGHPENAVTSNADTIYSITARELRSNHIPDSVFRMKELKSIFIQGMDCDYGDHTQCREITEIPAEIKNLTALVSLHLTVNSIRKLPAEMAALKQLKVLNLSDNAGLQSYDVITELPGLEILHLYGCNLSRLPENIANLTHLKELGLAGNHFDEKEKERIRKALPHCRIVF